ncbi:MAG TPA: hypothetical protein VII75_16805 [Thermoanaerobaculia bacterium]
MRPAGAIAWEFHRRHRWGFIALGVYVAALAVIKFVVLRGRPIAFRDAESFAFAVIFPLTATCIYFLAVFTFGLDGDIAARESIYPRRLFTLPLSSDALAGLPMLYGGAAAAVLWLATRAFAIWPADERVPIVWPALLAASLLAWTQALTWLSYPLRGLRVIVTVLWLSSIDAIVLAALQFKAGELVMLAILAPHVPLAYLVARAAVRRARCGDVPDWQRSRVATASQRGPFASAMNAQLWFEWRRHGRSLPLLVAMLLPFELAMLALFHETQGIVVEVFIMILSTPIVMAAFVAATVATSNAFTATRPVIDVSLIAAKLKAATWSALSTWLLVIVATTVTLQLSGAAVFILDGQRWLTKAIGAPRATIAILLGITFLIGSTWKQLVQSLAVGMSGRAWLPKGSLFLTLTLLAIVLPSLHWITRSKQAMALVWASIPWVAGALVLIKTVLALWIAMRLFDKRVLSDRALVAGAACWSALVFLLAAGLMAIFPDVILRHYVLIFVAILQVPLVRLAAAPLALDWSRHR